MTFFCPGTRRPALPTFDLILRADTSTVIKSRDERRLEFEFPITPAIDLNCEDQSAEWTVALKSISIPTDFLTTDVQSNSDGTIGTSRFFLDVFVNDVSIGKQSVPACYSPNSALFMKIIQKRVIAKSPLAPYVNFEVNDKVNYLVKMNVTAGANEKVNVKISKALAAIMGYNATSFTSWGGTAGPHIEPFVANNYFNPIGGREVLAVVLNELETPVLITNNKVPDDKSLFTFNINNGLFLEDVASNFQAYNFRELLYRLLHNLFSFFTFSSENLYGECKH